LSSPARQNVLEIDRLSVSYRTDRGQLKALREVSLAVPRGKIVGIVGESGCGKSTLISSVIRLLAPNAQLTGGAIRFHGEDLFALDEKAMRALRGTELAMVFQDPMTSLNPVLSIGRQMRDIQYRERSSKKEKGQRSMQMLQRVGIPDPAERLHDYPHQLSGGMRQRVAIAMALMMKPSLLIADEPTTALDATLEVQIIHQLKALQEEIGCSILFISHHLGVIAELCDEVVVMYAGEVVESGTTRAVFRNPIHPYTQKLLECDPARIAAATRNLPVIGGTLPDLVNLPGGCVFRSRCDRSIDICALERPALCGGNHCTACHVAGL
jgi:oligopeptide/dipeptide ABC transporter ATP-binding protein